MPMRSVAERSVVLQHTCFGTGNSANATADVSDSAFAVLATDNSSRSQRYEPDVVGVFLHELLPPGALDVVFQLHAERAVVPGVGEAAVDLGARVHKAAVLAQGDDLVHSFFGVFHCFSSLLRQWRWRKPNDLRRWLRRDAPGRR